MEIPCLYLAGFFKLLDDGIGCDDLVSVYSLFEGRVGVLESFYLWGGRKKFTETVSYLKAKLGSRFSILLDSGAYSWYEKEVGVFSDGIFVDYSWVSSEKFTKYFRRYIDWLKDEGRYLVDEYVNLDIVRNPDLSYLNWLKMREEGLNPMPVLHEGADFKYVDTYMQHSDVSRLGLGVDDRTGKIVLWWLDPLFRYITSNYPTLKLHGFGCFLRDIVYRYGFFSMDTATWRRGGGGFGTLYWFNGRWIVTVSLNQDPSVVGGSLSSSYCTLVFSRDLQAWSEFLSIFRKVVLALGEDIYVAKIDGGSISPQEVFSLMAGKGRRERLRRSLFNAFSYDQCWKSVILNRREEGYGT